MSDGKPKKSYSAVTIKYDRDDSHSVPTVIAKGQNIWADRLLDESERLGIPIVKNVSLTQALVRLDIDEEVPEELYEAVAEVLNFVYQLSEEQKKKGR